MTDTPLMIRRDGTIAELTLNRPQAMNALNQALVAALTDAFRDLSQDTDLRAIILTGQGRAFCAGVDLKELSERPGAIEQMTWTGAASLFDVIAACPHPIIAAINGFAITGGLELAMMADFMIAGHSAKFADTHARVGITPSWGMTQALPRLIGINRARQMSLTGEFVDATKAGDWGLVNETVADADLMARARDLAGQIGETDQTTLTKIRHLIGQSREHTFSQGMAQEVALFDDHIAGVAPDDVAANRAAVTARGRGIAAQSGETTDQTNQTGRET